MAGKISLYFTNYRNNTYEMPIAPEEVHVKTESGNEKVNVINLGEISRLASATKLSQMDIALTLPMDLRKRKSYWTAKKIKYPSVKGGQKYVRFLEAVFQRHEVVRVVFTGTRINKQFTFDSFEYSLSGSGDEYKVNISMSEWRDYSPLVLKKAPLPKKSKKKVIKKKKRPSKKLGVGSTVIVNGRLHYSSWGDRPGVTEKNARRKINFVAPGRKCPYHVTNMQGGWRGWVTAKSIRKA